MVFSLFCCQIGKKEAEGVGNSHGDSRDGLGQYEGGGACGPVWWSA